MFNRRFFLQAGSLAALGRLSWSGVWNTPLHRQYEDELARWWNEEGARQIIYGDGCDKTLAPFLTLPNLAGLWAMQEDGGIVADESGNGRSLTEQNNPTYGQANSSPCTAYLNATTTTGLARDDANLNPTAVATLGGWFWLDSLAPPFSAHFVAGIYEVLQFTTQANQFGFGVYGDGGENTWFTSDVPAGEWVFICGVVDLPNDVNKLWIGTAAAGLVQVVNDSTNLGNAFNEQSVFSISHHSTPGTGFPGRAALTFLCHAALSDELVQFIYTSSILSPQPGLNSLFTALPDLRAYWSMFATDATAVYDNSGNNQNLTINDPSVTISTTNGVPYAQLPAPSIANLSRSHDTLLQLTDEATIGCWVRIANTTTSGPVIHKGAAGASTFLDFSYSLASDADNGYYCTFKQANNTTVSLAIEAGVDLDFDPLDWHFVVARFKRGNLLALTVNLFTKTTAVANSPLATTSHPLVIAQAIDNGIDPAQIDIALPFICATYVSNNRLKNIYKQTRQYFV